MARTGPTEPQTHAGSGRNPLLPIDVFLPDPEARVMPDGRLYLYGSWDESEARYCSDRYHVASSGDLRSWTVHDVAFVAEQADWAADPAGRATSTTRRSFLDGVASYDELPGHILALLPPGATDVPFDEFAAAVRAETERRAPDRPLLYAPDAVHVDGRYYLYFCMSDDSEGVAVSNRPDGPFTDAVRLPVDGIDPSVFVDDDGQAYYYWGQFTASGARLGTDMISLDLESVRPDLVTEREHHFHEGASMRKREGIYYLVFSDTSRGRPTCLGYATSTSPLGPFTYRGVIVDNADADPEAWNNHGSIEEFEGRWYVFYHRNSRRVNSMRRACAEPIEFTDDGTIPEVPMTSQGPGAPFAPGELVPGYAACRLTGGAHLVPLGDSEAIVGFDDGASATFRYVDLPSGRHRMRFTADGDGVIEVVVDGAVVGSGDVAAGSVVVDVPGGLHELVVVARRPTDLVLVDLTFEGAPPP